MFHLEHDPLGLLIPNKFVQSPQEYTVLFFFKAEYRGRQTAISSGFLREDMREGMKPYDRRCEVGE